MAALHKSNKEKISLRVKSSTLYRILKKCYTYKNRPFLYDKNVESKKKLSLTLINKSKKEIIIELKTQEKETVLTHFFRRFGHFCKFVLTKKEEQEYAYFKLDKYKLFNFLKFKINGKIKIKPICLYSKDKSKKYKNQEKKIINIEGDRNQSINTKDTTLTILNRTKLIDFSFSKKNYCNYYPNKNEMRERADKLLCHFPTECFHDVNHEHNRIGNKDFLVLKESSVYNSNNDSYKNIDIKDHIFLNHLYQKNVNNTIINSSTIRYRHKNVTFIYYK